MSRPNSVTPPTSPEPLPAPTSSVPDRFAAPGAAIEPRPPWRLAVALAVAGGLWVGTFLAALTVLVPARLELIAPDSKVALVATLSVVGSIVALLANILFGALSDLTRTRLGGRTPWLLAGSLASAGCLLLLSQATSVPAFVLMWCLFQFALNAIVAPMTAVIPDRVPWRLRATYSAIYGGGVMTGAGLGAAGAAAFIANPTRGFVVFAALVLLSGPVMALLAPDKSNRDVPRAAFSRDMVLSNFSFPRAGARDFYIALVGKLLVVLAIFMITGYQLFIATDYFGLDTAGAGALIATVALIQLGLSLVSGLIAGPISDRIGRRKAPVVLAALIIAAAALVPFVWRDPTAMLVFAVVGLGIGQGVFNSLDQALNYEVLPNAEATAKDLGILNMSNTGGQILGPLAMSAVVGVAGGYGAGFAVSAVVAVLAAVLLSRIRSVR